MEPGHFAVVSWIPNQTNSSQLRDTITIYDAGNIQGFLFKVTGKTTWVVFQVDYRLLQEDGSVLEGRTILPQQEAPLYFNSIETYPMRLQSQGKFQILLTLPQTQIFLTLSEEPLTAAQPSRPQPSHPTKQQQPPPSPSQRSTHAGPGSHGPLKSGSLKRAGGQPSSRNKSTLLPTQKVLSSSSPKNHAQPLSQAPTTQEAHQQQSLPEHHTGRESSESPPWTTLAQQSLYSRPPPDLEGVLVEQA